MRKSIKITLRVVAAMAFFGALTFSVQQNENGNWTLSPRTTFAQGGSEDGSENNDCDVCVANMMLKYKTCLKYWAIYDSSGKKIRAGVASGSRMPCVTKQDAVCNQTLQKPCDAQIPPGAVVESES